MVFTGMRTENKRINWALLIAVTLAAILLTRFGAIGFCSVRSSVDFSGLSKVIDGYSSRSLRLDKTSMKMLQPDAYVARAYQADDGRSADFLLVYGRNKDTFHSPGYCLVGGGWTVVNKWKESIPVQIDGKQKMCRLNFMKLRKQDNDMLVAWCFVERNRVTDNLIWMNSYLLYDGLTRRAASGALFRVMVPVYGSTDEASETVHTFVGTLMPQVVEAITSGTDRSRKN
jgi:EpsI family protein